MAGIWSRLAGLAMSGRFTRRSVEPSLGGSGLMTDRELPIMRGQRRSELSFVPSMIRVVAPTVDRVRPAPAGIVVLLYHRVGGRTPVRVDLPTPAFDAQLAELAESGAVLAIDEGVDFPDEGQPASWAALQGAVESGLVTIGSHTHSHALLDRLPVDQIADELDRSIELIGQHLDVSADHFAYPKALPPSADADRLVRERFVSASLAGTRGNSVGTDLHCLHRSPVQTTDQMSWFRHKAAGGLRFEDDLRRVVNRRRYAGATS